MPTWQATAVALLFVSAGFATLVAFMGYDIVCVHYEGQQPACFGRPTEWELYRWLSLGGLVVAGAAVYFAYCGPRRVSVSLLLIALAVYVVSALFADAGSHGWDGLRYFPKVG
jgi:hypothetical protein